MISLKNNENESIENLNFIEIVDVLYEKNE